MRYGKILSLGDPLLENLWKGKWVIEEKIDGSQFRVWVKDKNLYFGSKNVDYSDERPVDQMFQTAVSRINEVREMFDLNTDALYVFEYLKEKKHNTLEYSRVPSRNLMFLDYWSNGKPDLVFRDHLGEKYAFEVPQLILSGDHNFLGIDNLKEILEKESMLGGTKIEGIVIKNLNESVLYGGKIWPLYAKYVREEFKELNREQWGDGESLEQRIMKQFPLEPRWVKVIQHARDEGKLTSTPKDIGELIKLVRKDFSEECKETIKENLWEEFHHGLLNASSRGFPEFYKTKLVEESLK